MATKEYVSYSRENVRKNGLFSFIIFFFAALLVSAMFCLNLLFDYAFILAVPLLILPTMFAFQRAIIILRDADTLSFSLVFSGYRKYFSERFMSTYSFFKTLLWVGITYLALSFVSSLAVNIIFYTTNYMGYTDMIYEIIEAPLTVESLEVIYENHIDLFNIYRMFLALPPLSICSLLSLFFFSRNSTSFFMRSSAVTFSGKYISNLSALTHRRYSKKFYSMFFYLNWPLFVLYIGGFALGGYLGSLYHFDLNTIFTFGVALGLFVSFALFGFKYFANKEAIYKSLLNEYQETDEYIKRSNQEKMEKLKQAELEYQKILKELEDSNEDDEDDSNSD